MAPKGGKSSGGGVSFSSSSCPDAFQGDFGNVNISYFVADCVFFLVALFTLIAMGKIRKRHPGAKRLLGPIYIISLVFILLTNALLIITTLLNQCDTLADPYDYYKLLIPIAIFDNLAHFLLLVLVVYGVNSLLRQHHGHNPSYFNFIYGAILVVVGGLCAGLIGIVCWNDSVYASSYYYGRYVYAEVYVRLTYFVLYLLAVIAASIMAAATIFSMRARGAINRNLITWTVALMFSMLFSTILYVAESAVYFTDGYFSVETSQAFNWLEAIFTAFAWICLLFIAKSNVRDMSMHNSLPQVYNAQNSAYNPVPVPQQQQLPYTVHNGPPPPLQQQQPYYYQQQPEFVGVGNGNAHTTHIK